MERHYDEQWRTTKALRIATTPQTHAHTRAYIHTHTLIGRVILQVKLNTYGEPSRKKSLKKQNFKSTDNTQRTQMKRTNDERTLQTKKRFDEKHTHLNSPNRHKPSEWRNKRAFFYIVFCFVLFLWMSKFWCLFHLWLDFLFLRNFFLLF